MHHQADCNPPTRFARPCDAAHGIRFRVALGLYDVEVWAADANRALVDGRRRLCLELPRLWDVIQQAEGGRFTITSLEQRDS